MSMTFVTADITFAAGTSRVRRIDKSGNSISSLKSMTKLAIDMARIFSNLELPAVKLLVLQRKLLEKASAWMETSNRLALPRYA